MTAVVAADAASSSPARISEYRAGARASARTSPTRSEHLPCPMSVSPHRRPSCGLPSGQDILTAYWGGRLRNLDRHDDTLQDHGWYLNATFRAF